MRLSSLCLLSLLILQGCIFAQSEATLSGDASPDQKADTIEDDSKNVPVGPPVTKCGGVDLEQGWVCCGGIVIAKDEAEAGIICCEGIKIDPATDSNNCGACGTKCGEGLVCAQGTCGCDNPKAFAEEKQLKDRAGNSITVKPGDKVQVLPYLLSEEPHVLIFVKSEGDLMVYLIDDDGEIIHQLKDESLAGGVDNFSVVNFGDDYLISELGDVPRKSIVRRVRYTIKEEGLRSAINEGEVYGQEPEGMTIQTATPILATTLSHDYEGPLAQSVPGCVVLSSLHIRQMDTEPQIVAKGWCYKGDVDDRFSRTFDFDDVAGEIDDTFRFKTATHIRPATQDEQTLNPLLETVVEFAIGGKIGDNAVGFETQDIYFDSSTTSEEPDASFRNQMAQSTRGPSDIYFSWVGGGFSTSFLTTAGLVRSQRLVRDENGTLLLDRRARAYHVLNRQISAGGAEQGQTPDPFDHVTWISPANNVSNDEMVVQTKRAAQAPKECISPTRNYARVITSRFGSKSGGALDDFIAIVATKDGALFTLVREDD